MSLIATSFPVFPALKGLGETPGKHQIGPFRNVEETKYVKNPHIYRSFAGCGNAGKLWESCVFRMAFKRSAVRLRLAPPSNFQVTFHEAASFH
jgi:hypothetical protein